MVIERRRFHIREVQMNWETLGNIGSFMEGCLSWLNVLVLLAIGVSLVQFFAENRGDQAKRIGDQRNLCQCVSKCSPGDD